MYIFNHMYLKKICSFLLIQLLIFQGCPSLGFALTSPSSIKSLAEGTSLSKDRGIQLQLEIALRSLRYHLVAGDGLDAIMYEQVIDLATQLRRSQTPGTRQYALSVLAQLENLSTRISRPSSTTGDGVDIDGRVATTHATNTLRTWLSEDQSETAQAINRSLGTGPLQNEALIRGYLRYLFRPPDFAHPLSEAPEGLLAIRAEDYNPGPFPREDMTHDEARVYAEEEEFKAFTDRVFEGIAHRLSSLPGEATVTAESLGLKEVQTFLFNLMFATDSTGSFLMEGLQEQEFNRLGYRFAQYMIPWLSEKKQSLSEKQKQNLGTYLLNPFGPENNSGNDIMQHTLYRMTHLGGYAITTDTLKLQKDPYLLVPWFKLVIASNLVDSSRTQLWAKLVKAGIHRFITNRESDYLLPTLGGDFYIHKFIDDHITEQPHKTIAIATDNNVELVSVLKLADVMKRANPNIKFRIILKRDNMVLNDASLDDAIRTLNIREDADGQSVPDIFEALRENGIFIYREHTDGDYYENLEGQQVNAEAAEEAGLILYAGPDAHGMDHNRLPLPVMQVMVNADDRIFVGEANLYSARGTSGALLLWRLKWSELNEGLVGVTTNELDEWETTLDFDKPPAAVYLEGWYFDDVLMQRGHNITIAQTVAKSLGHGDGIIRARTGDGVTVSDVDNLLSDKIAKLQSRKGENIPTLTEWASKTTEDIIKTELRHRYSQELPQTRTEIISLVLDIRRLEAIKKHIEVGVYVSSLEHMYIDPDIRVGNIAEGVELLGRVELRGADTVIQQKTVINNSRVTDSFVEEGVVIEDNSSVQNQRIRERARITRSHLWTEPDQDGNVHFGIGTEISVGPELVAPDPGRRRLLLHPDLTIAEVGQMVYRKVPRMLQIIRDHFIPKGPGIDQVDAELRTMLSPESDNMIEEQHTARVQEAMKRKGAEKPRGDVGEGAFIRDTAQVINGRVGRGVVIDHAGPLRDFYTADAYDDGNGAITIGSGAQLEKVVIQEGVVVEKGAVVNTSMVMEGTHIGAQAHVFESIIGPANIIEKGQVGASVTGISFESHHPGMTLAYVSPLGRTNIGALAAFGSNYQREPDQEGWGWLTFVGLSTAIGLPSNFGLGTFLARGIKTPPQRIDFPFSLVAPLGLKKNQVPDDADNTYNQISPAAVLTDFTYFLEWNKLIYQDRKTARRPGNTTFTDDVINDATFHLLTGAAHELENLQGKGFGDTPLFWHTHHAGLGYKNIMTEASRAKAVEAYQNAARRYALQEVLSIIASIPEKADLTMDDIRTALRAHRDRPPIKWLEEHTSSLDTITAEELQTELSALKSLEEAWAAAIRAQRAKDYRGAERAGIDDYEVWAGPIDNARLIQHANDNRDETLRQLDEARTTLLAATGDGHAEQVVARVAQEADMPPGHQPTRGTAAARQATPSYVVVMDPEVLSLAFVDAVQEADVPVDIYMTRETARAASAIEVVTMLRALDQVDIIDVWTTEPVGFQRYVTRDLKHRNGAIDAVLASSHKVLQAAQKLFKGIRRILVSPVEADDPVAYRQTVDRIVRVLVSSSA